MKVTYRLASAADADRLFDIRRQAITALATRKISVAEAETWAATLTIDGMEKKLRTLEIWVAEAGGAVVGWGAIREDRLEGLYTIPEFAGRGVGTDLLRMLENFLRARGIQVMCTEASQNAEAFYLRRGYEPAGARTPEGAQPVSKRLL